MRQRINESAQAVMVAYAIGSDLDQQAARNNLKRLTITPGNLDAVPPVDAVMESDDALRVRVPPPVRLAPQREGFFHDDNPVD